MTTNHYELTTIQFKTYIQKLIYDMEFDAIEALLDEVDWAMLGKEKTELLLKLLKPYSSEFEFWPEYVIAAKRIM
jgi:hypothetical protein